MICRVVPDVAAVPREFDYTVPDELSGTVRVGALVRVNLHGRRVRGWVVDDDVVSAVDAASLRPLLTVVSAGPPVPVVELSAWAAHRWCGSRVAFLRGASPPNIVRAGAVVARSSADTILPPEWPDAGAAPARDALALAHDARADTVATVRWPPLLDRRLLVAGLLADDGSSIVVVADGSRGRALVQWLRGAGAHAVFLHSDLADAERSRAWATAAAGRVVVVGGRVAALSPVPDLRGAIVVDDSDEALQEERTPTWHARDLLAERARRAGARFAVVSAAPSVEAEVLSGSVRAPARASEIAGWPRVEVVDRREAPPGSGLLSERIAAALNETRAAGDVAVCVLNRRGRVRLLACSTCHQLVRWDREGAPAWDRAGDARLDAIAAPAARPDVCPQCGGTRLRVLRAGVTRVREEIAALLPGAVVTEVDAGTGVLTPDTIARTNVFVGTEAALQRVEVRRRRPALVAFLDFDQELFATRARAAEQALWLVARAARLIAAHDRSRSRVLLQTRVPEHEVVRAAATGEPARVAEAERARRRALRFPPFGGLAEISGAADAVDVVAAALRADTAPPVEVLGPDHQGTTARALVRAADPDRLADALAIAVPAGRSVGRLHVAVDPTRV